MKFTQVMVLCYFIAILVPLSGCVSKSTTTGADTEETSTVAEMDQPPKTLAILPFENNSVTDPEQYAPLSSGLSAMLITDLNRDGSSIKIIERAMIKSLLQEVALSQSGSVDQNTAIRVGKLLGAQAIAFGSFMVLGNNVRIDLRIVKVETSEMLMAESVSGLSDDFIGLERKLARNIAKSLRMALQPPVASGKSDIDAALAFSKGLEALDSGNKSEARRLFDKSIALDPSYQKQVDSVEGIE